MIEPSDDITSASRLCRPSWINTISRMSSLRSKGRGSSGAVLAHFRRITVRQSRCSASGTKLRISSCATKRFTKRSASGKSRLRPPAARFDWACARCSVPDPGLVSARVRRVSLQYCSSASQTGRQYCAVDSITTSSTSRSTSQSASARNWTGLVPIFSRSKWKSPSTATSATATANIFLCTSIPAM